MPLSQAQTKVRKNSGVITPQPRGQTTHARGRQLPRRAQRAHAHMRARALRDLQ